MRKLLCTALAFLLALNLAACGGETAVKDDAAQTEPVKSEEAEVPTEAVDQLEPEQEPVENASIETEENLLTVDITIPASYLDAESEIDEDAYAQENGYLAAHKNADGSVTVTMTKARHQELIRELTASIEEAYAGIVEDEATSYVKEISHNDDFTNVTIKVDRAAYESTWDFTVLTVGLSVGLIQAFMDMEAHAELLVVDVDTGETISTTIYPDDFAE